MQITAAVIREAGANFTLEAVELDEPRAHGLRTAKQFQPTQRSEQPLAGGTAQT
jgi:Zn-dependent alcohol dehydrogenase